MYIGIEVQNLASYSSEPTLYVVDITSAVAGTGKKISNHYSIQPGARIAAFHYSPYLKRNGKRCVDPLQRPRSAILKFPVESFSAYTVPQREYSALLSLSWLCSCFSAAAHARKIITAILQYWQAWQRTFCCRCCTAICRCTCRHTISNQSYNESSILLRPETFVSVTARSANPLTVCG